MEKAIGCLKMVKSSDDTPQAIVTPFRFLQLLPGMCPQFNHFYSLLIKIQELRNRVYDILIEDILARLDGKPMCLSLRRKKVHLKDDLSPFAPAHVSKQIRVECLPLLRRTLTVQIHYQRIKDAYVDVFYPIQDDAEVMAGYHGNIIVRMGTWSDGWFRSLDHDLLPLMQFVLRADNIHFTFSGPHSAIWTRLFNDHRKAWASAVQSDLAHIWVNKDEEAKNMGLVFREDAPLEWISQVPQTEWYDPPPFMLEYAKELGWEPSDENFGRLGVWKIPTAEDDAHK